MDAPLLNAEAPPSEPKTVRLGFVAGVIQQEKLMPFERLLFRATRGNMFLKNVPVGAVVDPGTAEKVEKAVFRRLLCGRACPHKDPQGEVLLLHPAIAVLVDTRKGFGQIHKWPGPDLSCLTVSGQI